MNRVTLFWRSTVGKKVIMALTGSVLVSFVIGHMIGNLKMFATCEVHNSALSCKIDKYAEFLRNFGSDLFGHGGFLWLVRIGLLISAVLHVICAIQLTLLNRKAKSQGYVNPQYSSSTIASRTMAYGGMLLSAFIIFHILHFTTGTLHFRDFIEGKVYDNVTNAFQSPLIVGFYLLAMCALGLHLYHGTWSMFQTLSIDSPSYNKIIRFSAKIIAILVFIGFISVPIAIFLGLLPSYNI
jgi:succinate dehydrogenase / fumarate reductase, cytochrome b subunit